MPQIISRTLEAYRLNVGNLQDIAGKYNFVLAGYSPKAMRMVGHAFFSETESGEVEEAHDFPSFAAPEVGSEDILRLNSAGFVADEIGLREIAMCQFRTITEHYEKGFPGGGRFFIAEIRKGRILIEEACHFPPRNAA